ncbi:MAG: hypothetical protein ACFFDF_05145 [Candidatus Odinarchaeota archaeon]
MDMKTFKKTFKLICDSCKEFTHTDTQYCENCGSDTLRKATKDDYERYEKIATQKSKESRHVADELRKEDNKIKKDADKVRKEEKKAQKKSM